MKDSELLILAKAEIALPTNWAKDYFARDANGQQVDVLSDGACKFCTMGAVHKAIQRRVKDGVFERRRFVTTSSRLFELLLASISVFKNEECLYIATFNDDENTKHEDVLAVFDLAIETAKKKE